MQNHRVRQYEKLLLELRRRTGEELTHMVEVVREGGRASGEHDAHPSESAESAIILESNEERIHGMIRQALQRIDAGTYGICLRCQGEIPETRLRAIPYAEHCIKCERLLQRGS